MSLQLVFSAESKNDDESGEKQTREVEKFPRFIAPGILELEKGGGVILWARTVEEYEDFRKKLKEGLPEGKEVVITQNNFPG